MNILAAAIMLNNGVRMRRQAWSINPEDNNFHQSLEAGPEGPWVGHIYARRKDGNQFTIPQLTIEDLMADDWCDEQFILNNIDNLWYNV